MAGRGYPEVYKMRISLDTETGGLEAAENPLLQVSLWQPEGPCFEERVLPGPGMKIHPRALQANGLDPAVGIPADECARRLVAWWKSIGSPRFELIGQNVGPFDVPFLKQLTRVGVDVPWAAMFDYHYRDTSVLAFALQDAGILHFGKWSLTNICQVLGILYDPHLARCDAKAAWHAWHRMEGVLSILKAKSPESAAELRTGVLHALDLRG